jgi:hypothetical protein
MTDSLYGSICLSDIPKELITTGKNGKKYLNVCVDKRKQVSQYGATHYIKAYAKKGTIDPNTNLYIGDLKPSQTTTYAAPAVQAPMMPPPAAEELPF